MMLSEKIYDCRKKAGLSQEALAERLGVSRQAVSKWETGEAVPEIGKLLLLSRAFGVSTDWLLSEDEPEESREEPRYDSPYDRPQEHSPSGAPNWIDSVPGLIGRLLRKYGWLFGVYTAVSGLPFVVIGALARALSRSMVSSFETSFGSPFGAGFGGGEIWYDAAGNVIASPFGSSASGMAAGNPVAVMGAVFIVIGLVLVAAGVALAVILKRRGGDS